METLQYKLDRSYPRILGFGLACLAGLAVVAVVSQLGGGISAKQGVGVLLVMGIVFAGFLSGYPKEVFLFFWVFALTYNRQYFIFEGLVGPQNWEGPYLIASDMFFGLLLLLWLYEHISSGVQEEPRGRSMWPWYLPLATACVLSVFAAVRVDWTFYELIRVAKVALVLTYLRYNLRKREWWVCAAGLGGAMCFQSALGTIEVISKRSGVLWLVGLSGGQETLQGSFEEEFNPEFWYGWYRATATMSHPPNLACYLLQTIPMYVALGLTVPRRWVRWLCAAAGLLGLLGLAMTLSRWPWALMVAQLSVLLTGLVAFRLLPLKRALGVVFLSLMLMVLALAPLRAQIEDRLVRDLTPSAEGRIREMEIAWKMFTDRPFWGVGLNNSRAHIIEYNPELASALELEATVAHTLHLRALVSPQNGFLLILMEAGVFGLAGFLIYLFGVFRVALRAVNSFQDYRRAACFGLALGLAGVILQQAVDFSYWVDPLLYTFTIVVGMLNTSSVLLEGEPDQAPQL